MTVLAEKALDAIRSHRLLVPGEAVLVAVSGGCDSVVLLRLLHELASRERWRLAVAHFNHRLRGPDADADESAVKTLAAGLSLPCHVGSGDTRAVAGGQGVSLEMASRDLRHRFLARIAREQGITKVALAHHLDDQIETLFLRLLRGTSGEGAAGMRWICPSPSDRGIQLVRPLLDGTRDDLRHAAQTAGWSWREDRTNAQPDALRNRVRQELIPLLSTQYQPALREVIKRFMAVSGAEADLAAALACDWLGRAGDFKGEPGCPGKESTLGLPGGGVREAEYAELPVAVQRQVLLSQLRERGIGADFALLDRLLGAAGTKVTIAPGRRVWRDERGRVREDTVVESGFQPGRCVLEMWSASGAGEFDGLHFQWERFDRPVGDLQIPRDRPGEEWFDADLIGERVVLRHWQAGDRYQPIGLVAPTKLQDLFVNAKVPRSERHVRIVAETADGALFWVEGLRVGEAARVRSDTRRIVRWITARSPA